MPKSKTKAIEKEKIQSIKWVIEDFLEEDLSKAMLKSNPNRVEKLGEGLKKNLFSKQSGWIMSDSFDFVEPDEPSEWGEPLVKPIFQGENLEKNSVVIVDPCQKIMYYYNTLDSIWSKLKNGIRGQRHIRKNFLEIGKLDLTVDLGLNKLSFEKSLYVQMSFISLVEGARYSIFRECQAPNCKRWFVSAHKTKKFCQEKCCNRDQQTKHRARDPEAYKASRRKSQKKRALEEIYGK